MTDPNEKPEFWEATFAEKREMWGLEPAVSALRVRDIFVQEKVRNILMPGIGYGRNAKPFLEAGMLVTGIEISPTAIELAREHFGDTIAIHQGSVTEMPFDDRKYDGIFCHALIHLLDSDERAKFIRDCFSQLELGGRMILSTITKAAHTFGTGTPVGKDRFEIFPGVKMYFYDRESIAAEFAQAGLVAIEEIADVFPFYLITCTKTE
jgi:SAM-dependent methyltransferase